MNIKADPKKAKILLSLITLVSSFFIAGYINTIGSQFGSSWQPFVILACMVYRGFPIGCFIFFFLIFGGLSTVFYQKYLKPDDKQEDAMGRSFVLSDSNSYGQAHFERPEEYENEATIETPETALGMIYGQCDDSGKKLIVQRLDEKHRGNQNVAIIGSSGSGKTFTTVGPAILQIVRRMESLIITDPDGGLFKRYSWYLKQRGYKARRISMNDMHKSDGWDCLKSVKNVEDATLFAEAVISNVLDASDQNSIYGSGSKILLKALILRVILDQNLSEEEKTIQTVYRALLDHNTDEKLGEYIRALEEQGDMALPCLDAYKTFQLNGEKMRDNIRGNLAVYLQVLADPLVSKILSTNDIDLELPATEPCAYFCGFPDGHNTYKFITSLFFSMIFIRLYNYADVTNHGKLDIPVNFILDEFPSIGGLPDWDRKMATLRKRNINVMMIFQDIAQFQNIYEKSWGTILNNCKTMILLGINEDKSAALMSKRIGDTTIHVRTEQHAVGSINDWWAGGKESVGEGKRSLVSYSELFTMDENDAIILFQGHNPVHCRKYPLSLHPDVQNLKDVDFDSIPDIYDTIGREQVKEADEAYRIQYLAEHPLSEIDRTYKNLYKKRRQQQESVFQTEVRKLATVVVNKMEQQLNNEKNEDEDLIQLDVTNTFTIADAMDEESPNEKGSDMDDTPESQEMDSIEISEDEDDDWGFETQAEQSQLEKQEEERDAKTSDGDRGLEPQVSEDTGGHEDRSAEQTEEKEHDKIKNTESQATMRKRERNRREAQMMSGKLEIVEQKNETKCTLPDGLPGKRKQK